MSRSSNLPSIMPKSFFVLLAWRNLRSHTLRTFLTLIGMIIGISAIVFLLAFAYGIEQFVTHEVSNGNALVLLDVSAGNSQIISIDDTVVSEIATVPNVKKVYSLTGVAAKSDSGGSTSDIGMYATSESFLTLSGIRLKSGSFFEPGTQQDVVINSAYAKLLRPGDANVVGQTVGIGVTIPKELSNTPTDLVIPRAIYTVTGIFQDDSTPKAYTSLANLEEKGLKNFSQVKVEANKEGDIPAIRKEIESMGMQTQYVGDTISQINQVFLIFKAILASFGAVTLAVALLGMFNTLTISLLERTKEVALMKILGMRRRDIRFVFLTESIILGIVGGVLGIAWGLVLGRLANYVLNFYATKSGGSAVVLFYYPVVFMVTVLVISFVLGVLTGWYPARRAMRISPLDVLRNE